MFIISAPLSRQIDRRPFAALSRPIVRLALVAAATLVAAGCDSNKSPTSVGTITTTSNPCTNGSSLQLSVAQAALVDCTNGGTTVTLAGNGASYLVVAQFPVSQVTDALIPYSLSTTTLTSAALSVARGKTAAPVAIMAATSAGAGLLPPMQPHARQLAFDRALNTRARSLAAWGAFKAAASENRNIRQLASLQATVPTAGSTRAFHVLSSFDPNSPTWKTVTATLSYVGANVLLYVDNQTPTGGFSGTQVTQLGQLFDQTFYPIDTAAFGQPTDIDQNGHVIMLMSPVVNADTPASECETDGYVEGFFDADDFDGPTDVNSNQGEVFYSIAPDPNATVSCAHTVADVGSGVPATFLHELQHLIDFSQHVIVNGGDPEASWMDEGLSIVAEELGGAYYEQKCPPPTCRTNPSQIFPDSAQGFVQDFLYDSYEYALLPDTASVTLHDDSENGFSWRGGDWLLMRWLGDQQGNGVYKKLEHGPSDGVTDIQNATGQSFATLMANFGLALYTDSLPGLARATAPAANRFTSRNVRQLWARLFATSGPASDIPTAAPLQLFSITTDTSAAGLDPGTMSYYRLDAPSTTASVTIRFSSPGGSPLPASLHPQLAIFRLPAGQ